MSKRKIIIGVVALTMLAAAGVSSAVLAADNSNSFWGKFNGGPRGEQMQNLTEDQKAAMKVKMDAVADALNNGDYDAWVKAEKAVNENCPMLSKINKDNFSRFAEANKLRAQADNILKELGIPREGMGGGLGGRHEGMGGGYGRMQGNRLGTNNATATQN